MRLIVARFREDISWTSGLDCFVIEKGCHMPNQGREGGSFLWYILSRYDFLLGDYAFVQGYPFDHCPDLLEKLKTFKGGFQHLGSWYIESNPDGSPHDRGFNMSDPMEIMGLEPREKYPFVAGGQFVVDAETIKRFSRDQYQKLFEYACSHPKHPYALERVWESLFTCPT